MKTLIVSDDIPLIQSFKKNDYDDISYIHPLFVDSISGFDLVIWNPIYVKDRRYERVDKIPVKDKGTVLICCEHGSIGDDLIKLFSVKANAVLIIHDSHGVSYDLVDALGNLWCSTADEDDEPDLHDNVKKQIYRLYEWTKSSTRRESVMRGDYLPFDFENSPDMEKFCQIIRNVSDKVENQRGGRYFGNASTRCSKMFPSVRQTAISHSSDLFQYKLVSKRNISKDRIQPSDFVVVRLGLDPTDENERFSNQILYYGKDKPSVDTPTQIYLYNMFPNINFMIHGHAYLDTKFLGVNMIPFTKEYCSCGDLREIYKIDDIVNDKKCEFFIVNLINHGFLIGTNTLEQMESIVNGISFVYRNIGEEPVPFGRV